MKINQIIKEKRKEHDLTQEQVAQYLGVSTPAVHKWEKGTTYPDITLLPALARLLKIDLNTLLSFKDDLTDQEISHFTSHVVNVIQEKGFDSGFQLAMAKIQEYPACDLLIGLTALTLEGSLFMFPRLDKQPYLLEIEQLYKRVASSENTAIRHQANMMLIAKHMERREYNEAQMILNRFSDISFDKKQLQANLLIKQEKLDDAAELFEQQLMNAANQAHSALLGLLDIALKKEQMLEGQKLADLAQKTVKLFDLWDYTAFVAHFQLAVALKDAQWCVTLLKAMLSAMQKPWAPSQSFLYQHIKLKSSQESSFVWEAFSQSLLTEIISDDQLTFLSTHPEFKTLSKQYLTEA